MSTTTTVQPTTTSTTVAETTTTTVDRLAEVQAILQDLEERRLDALFQEDEEAFRALFASEYLWLREREALGVVDWDSVPGVDVAVVEVVLDDAACLVARARFEFSESLAASSPVILTVTLQPVESGWGFSFNSDSWLCVEPHPLNQ